MKLLPNKTFPHPVLWKRADDYLLREFQATCRLAANSKERVPYVECAFVVNEESIGNLINAKLADYAVEIYCSSTLVRRVFRTDKNAAKFQLEEGDLYGRVEVNAFIVCKESVANYTSKNFNKEFGENASFNLEPGDVLGAAETEIHFWDTEDTKPLQSVVVLVADPSVPSGQYAVDTTAQKIKIRMRPDDKHRFERMRRTKEQKRVAMFVYFAAIAEVLRQMSDEDEGKKWYRSIRHKLSAMPNAANDPDPFVTAQELLRNPLKNILS